MEKRTTIYVITTEEDYPFSHTVIHGICKTKTDAEKFAKRIPNSEISKSKMIEFINLERRK